MSTTRINESTEGVNMKIKWTPVETACSHVKAPAPAMESDLAVKGSGPGIGTWTADDMSVRG